MKKTFIIIAFAALYSCMSSHTNKTEPVLGINIGMPLHEVSKVMESNGFSRHGSMYNYKLKTNYINLFDKEYHKSQLTKVVFNDDAEFVESFEIEFAGDREFERLSKHLSKTYGNPQIREGAKNIWIALNEEKKYSKISLILYDNEMNRGRTSPTKLLFEEFTYKIEITNSLDNALSNVQVFFISDKESGKLSGFEDISKLDIAQTAIVCANTPYIFLMGKDSGGTVLNFRDMDASNGKMTITIDDILTP